MNNYIKTKRNEPLKVIIAGAGIVGLTTALALKKRGAEVTVLEQAPEIRAAGSTIALWKNALDVFSTYDIADEIYAIGKQLETWFYDASGNPYRASGYSPDTYSFLLVPRPQLTNLLAAAAGIAHIRTNSRITGFREEENQVTVYLANGTTETADLLIAADGVYSQIRRQLIPNSDAREHAGHEVWRGVIPLSEEPSNGTMFTIGYKRTRGGYTRTYGDQMMWMVNQFDSMPGGGTRKEEALKRASYLNEQGWNDTLIELINATPEDKILYNKIMFVPELPYWTSQRVALIGDAAHALSPHISSGGTLGIQDVKVLIAALDTRPDIATALKDYESNRMPLYKKVHQLSLDVEQATNAQEYSREYAKFIHWMLTEGYASSELDVI